MAPALDFPATPTNGQVYTQDGSSWTYDSTKGAWRSSPYEPGAAITSVTAPTNPQNGDIWFDTDDGTMYVYYNDGTSSQWTEMRSQIATSQVGLVPIVPPTVNVSGGTATANTLGQIDFNAVSSISINNVFSSRYDSYKILFRTTTAGANALQIRFRLRAGGTDNSATQYSFGVPLVSNLGNFTSYTGNGLTFFDLGNAATTFSAHNEISVSKPHNSSFWTSMNWTTFSHSSSNTFGGAGGGYHSVNYSADGFTIFPASSTITGTLQVFGFNC